MGKNLFYSLLFVSLILLNACATAPKQETSSTQTPVLSAADSALIIKAVEQQLPPKKTYPQNLDEAHEWFILAQQMELRGEKKMAEAFWDKAYEADPGNRYLAFAAARNAYNRGDYANALIVAEEALSLTGKPKASQYELLAKIYVKLGIVDSVRKYFSIAIDSSHHQDMSLLYDYALFLEAVKDTNELVKTYNLILPQLNFVESLFKRQLQLLLALEKDSMVVDLFKNAYEGTGDKRYLLEQIRCLLALKRFTDAKNVGKALTSVSTPEEAQILEMLIFIYEKEGRDSLTQFINRKYYEDEIHHSLVAYNLGALEYFEGKKDSAKTHLQEAFATLEDPMQRVQASRILTSIALTEKNKKDALLYAAIVDSLTPGGDKEFLATSYGYLEMYEEAYAALDSALLIWSSFKPEMLKFDTAMTAEKSKQITDFYKEKLIKTKEFYIAILLLEAGKIHSEEILDSVKIKREFEVRTKAFEFWKTIDETRPLDFTSAYSMAMNLDLLSKFDESFALYEKLLQMPNLKPERVTEIYNSYGYSLICAHRSQEEVEKGVLLVEKAIAETQDKDALDAYIDSRAWGLYYLGKFEEALTEMQKIKNENLFEDSEYLEHMAAINAALGNAQEAKKFYKKLLKIRPHHEQALEFVNPKKKGKK